MLLASIAMAIAITVLSSNVLARLKENSEYDYDYALQSEYRFILLHCIFFWMVGMYQASIGCFKLAVLLTFVLVFWPCILCYMYKYGENDDDTSDSEADIDPDHSNNSNNGRPRGRQRSRRGTLKKEFKDLSRKEVKKFLKIGFFKRKKNAVESINP